MSDDRGQRYVVTYLFNEQRHTYLRTDSLHDVSLARVYLAGIGATDVVVHDRERST